MLTHLLSDLTVKFRTITCMFQPHQYTCIGTSTKDNLRLQMIFLGQLLQLDKQLPLHLYRHIMDAENAQIASTHFVSDVNNICISSLYSVVS